MQMSGNTILITGGGSGIGFELAKQLHLAGNKILVTGRSATKLKKVTELLPGTVTFQSDVSKPEDIKKLHEEVTRAFPEMNILINNAGIMRTVNVHASTFDLHTLTNEIETNLAGPIRMIQQFLGHLKTKPAAAIVNVSSGLAFVPLPISPIYCATKAGLHSFTQSLRVQLKQTKVKVFELAPPATQTDLLGDFNDRDMKGITIMKVEELASKCLKAMQSDEYEIRPGQSNQLKFMSRVAPEFILKQMSKSVDRMLSETTN